MAFVLYAIPKYCLEKNKKTKQTLVSSVVGRAHLRSAASGMLVVPASSTKTIGPRAFAVSGPSSWNSGVALQYTFRSQASRKN